VATDLRDPYAIYGGLQDNGSTGAMSFTRDILGIRNDASWKMHWPRRQWVRCWAPESSVDRPACRSASPWAPP
jgi:hypothetical protein